MGLREQPELACSTGGVRARAAAELGQDVAHVQVHGSRAEEEVSSDLPVRAADGHESDNLELPSGKPAVLELTGGMADAALIYASAELHELRASAAGERPSAELARCPVRICQSLDRCLALTGCGERDARAKLCLRALERELQRTEELERLKEMARRLLGVTVQKRHLSQRMRGCRERFRVAAATCDRAQPLRAGTGFGFSPATGEERRRPTQRRDGVLAVLALARELEEEATTRCRRLVVALLFVEARQPARALELHDHERGLMRQRKGFRKRRS